MTDQPYAMRAAELLETILETLESIEALEDLDMDLIDGVLNVEFEDGSQIIINRQEPVEQIWVASPLGPAHFGFDAEQGQWRDDRSGEHLAATLEKAITQKMGEAISLAGKF